MLSGTLVRIVLAGAFALIALGGAIALEIHGDGSPSWLVAVIATAAGYIFGHVEANGREAFRLPTRTPPEGAP